MHEQGVETDPITGKTSMVLVDWCSLLNNLTTDFQRHNRILDEAFLLYHVLPSVQQEGLKLPEDHGSDFIEAFAKFPFKRGSMITLTPKEGTIFFDGQWPWKEEFYLRWLRIWFRHQVYRKVPSVIIKKSAQDRFNPLKDPLSMTLYRECKRLFAQIGPRKEDMDREALSD